LQFVRITYAYTYPNTHNYYLGLRAQEIHLCGEASVVPLVKELCEALNDDVQVHHYERLTPLSISKHSLNGNYKNVKKGDCVVTFARKDIFDVKKSIERKTGLRCAVVYGALPPESRAVQARAFNDPDGRFDVLVASDAVGMGLNL
jgi:ATP-dependent RNA helicase SUPV3L1/SUV3